MRNGIPRRHWLTGILGAFCGWLAGHAPTAPASDPAPSNPAPTPGSLIFHGNGSFTYEPNAASFGPDSFTYFEGDFFTYVSADWPTDLPPR